MNTTMGLRFRLSRRIRICRGDKCMSESWRSKVWYVFSSGQTVWAGPENVGFAYAHTDWHVHWADDAGLNRWWHASPRSKDPAETCRELQAEHPGLPLRWTIMPANALFPLQPGTDPVVGAGNLCPK